MSGGLLVVVGMAAEAALLPPGTRVLVGGGEGTRLRGLLGAVGDDVAAVLSFGIAGGLAPGLAPGALVVATRVVAPGGPWLAEPGWAARLAQATGARPGVIAGAEAAVAGVAAKRVLRDATGADAVDCESAAVAGFAAARGVPFAVLRAVADPDGRALPQAALVGLTPDGRAAPGRVVRALLRRPGELPALLRVARDARAALAALGGAAAAMPSGLLRLSVYPGR